LILQVDDVREGKPDQSKDESTNNQQKIRR
jgi:hypothetical protein